MTSLAADAIQNYGNEQASFILAGNVVDAHGSNWKALLAASTHAASSYLPKELTDEFPVVNFEVVHIFVNLATKYNTHEYLIIDYFIYILLNSI